MANYYKVKAKCGHVGKRNYYEGTFYETAENGREAAAIVRQRPRVKHQHKDAILSVEKISFEEYSEGQAGKKTEAYFQCESPQEQGCVWSEIEDRIFPEPRYLIEEKEREPKWKRPYKRERFDWKREILDVV